MNQHSFLFISIRVVMGHLVATFWIHSYASGSYADITKGPVSVTALVGTNARFHCVGTGNYLVWEVDGLQTANSDIVSRGITDHTIPSSGTVQSNLTVPATSENNGTTVRCAVSVSLFSTPAISSYSTLTVLPGIGPVLNLRFNPSFTQVLWDPSLTVGVLSDLTYHLNVTNMNTGVVIINTTTTVTNYSLGLIQSCTSYSASVAAVSPEYSGDTVVIVGKTHGGYYSLTTVSREVFANQSGLFEVSFKIGLQISGLPCPKQKLYLQTCSSSAVSALAKQSIMIREFSLQDASKNLELKFSVQRSQVYTAIISIVGVKGLLQSRKLDFNTFAVQHCDVHTDNTSYIRVECTFAINSTAPGFVLIQDEHHNVSKTLREKDNFTLNALADFNGLSSGEYNLTVFDNKDQMTRTPSYGPMSLQIENNVDPGPQFSETSYIHHLGTSSLLRTSSSKYFELVNSVTPSPQAQPTFNSVVIVTVIGVLIIIIVLTVSLCLGVWYRNTKNKQDPLQTTYWNKCENSYEELNVKPLSVTVQSLDHDNQDNRVNALEPTYMESRTDYLPPTSDGNKVLHYATLQEFTNTPNAPPILCAQSSMTNNEPMYANIKDSTEQPQPESTSPADSTPSPCTETDDSVNTDVRERSMIVPTVMAVSCPSMGEKLNANVLGSTDYAYTDDDYDGMNTSQQSIDNGSNTSVVTEEIVTPSVVTKNDGERFIDDIMSGETKCMQYNFSNLQPDMSEVCDDEPVTRPSPNSGHPIDSAAVTSHTCDRKVHDYLQIKLTYMYLLMFLMVMLVVFVGTLFARVNRDERVSNKNRNTDEAVIITRAFFAFFTLVIPAVIIRGFQVPSVDYEPSIGQSHLYSSILYMIAWLIRELLGLDSSINSTMIYLDVHSAKHASVNVGKQVGEDGLSSQPEQLTITAKINHGKRAEVSVVSTAFMPNNSSDEMLLPLGKLVEYGNSNEVVSGSGAYFQGKFMHFQQPQSGIALCQTTTYHQAVP